MLAHTTDLQSSINLANAGGNALLKRGLSKSSANVCKPKEAGLKLGVLNKSTKIFKPTVNKSFEIKEQSNNGSKPMDTFKDHAPTEMELDETEQLEQEVKEMRESLHQSVEKTKYWKKKSLDIMQRISTDKKETAQKITQLESQIEELAGSGLNLKNQLDKAKNENAQALDAVVQCMEDHENLVATKNALVHEINTIQVIRSEGPDELQSHVEMVNELSGSLRTALDDLKILLEELEEVKKSVSVVTEEKEALESEAVCAALSSVASIDPQIAAACKSLQTKEEELIVLNGRVQKMIFKCSVLSQTNMDLKVQAKSLGIEMEQGIVESGDNAKLEKLCVDRYEKLLDAAKELVRPNDMDEN